MGVFYNSICLPGRAPETVREGLERWLSLRGFVRSEGEALFDLDGDTERTAFLLWNDRWCVVVFSKYEEERRLIRELQGVADPLLYVWVQDSDVWGFDLFDSRGFAGSFSSDPGGYQSFPEEAPLGQDGRPWADPEELCERLGRPGEGKALVEIQRKSATWEEEICGQFCRFFGVEAAMASYDELEGGGGGLYAGWQVESLRFVHRDALPEAPEVGLHDLVLDGLQSGVPYLAQSPQRALSPELRAEMEVMRRRARLRLRLLRPLVWTARLWRRFTGEHPAALGSRELKPPTAEESSLLGYSITNPRHGCKILLAPGAVERSVSGKPALVFTFQVGQILVSCTARRLNRMEHILRPPNRAKILRDERHTVGGDLLARSVLFELPPLYLVGSSEPSLLGLHVIQAPRALYVFLFRAGQEIDPLVDQTIRRTVESFRLLRG